MSEQQAEFIDTIRDMAQQREPQLTEKDPFTLIPHLTDAAKVFNDRVTSDFGGTNGRGELHKGKTEAAVGAAFQTFGDDELHPDPYEKAAVMLRGVTGGHSFPDGNKRTGFLLGVYFLELEGHTLPDKLPDHTYEFIMAIAEGRLVEVDVIAEGLKDIYAETYAEGNAGLDDLLAHMAYK